MNVNIQMTVIYALTAGFLLDLLLGDPVRFPHPVRLMGRMITCGESFWRQVFRPTDRGKFLGGTLLTLGVAGLCFLIPFVLLYLTGRLSPWLTFVLETVMCYQLLAVKALRQESMRVYTALLAGNLTEARTCLSRIVGRDTENLDSAAVSKATVETVAENLSDGVIAPMFFILLGGVPLGFFYKAVNTLDSMIGYKNEKYQYFGRFAARLDDLLNYVPARISAILMLIATGLLGYNIREAFRIFRRDRYNHQSPNSAQTEAVCAGALQVSLGGDSYYFGKLVAKPAIGDDTRRIEAGDIKRINQIMYLTSFLGLLLGSGIRILLVRLF